MQPTNVLNELFSGSRFSQPPPPIMNGQPVVNSAPAQKQTNVEISIETMMRSAAATRPATQQQPAPYEAGMNLINQLTMGAPQDLPPPITPITGGGSSAKQGGTATALNVNASSFVPIQVRAFIFAYFSFI